MGRFGLNPHAQPCPQLVLACGVLGVGVALLLDAALGSDGYSSLVSGLTLATGLPSRS